MFGMETVFLLVFLSSMLMLLSLGALAVLKRLGISVKAEFVQAFGIFGAVLIVFIWLMDSLVAALPDQAIGATIVIFTLIFNYFFRKAKANGSNTSVTPTR